jgi:flagellar biogenesis protein FliO
MRIPAGQHTIDFKFEPESFAKGEIITLISSLLLLFGVIGAVVYEVMKARKHNNGGQVQTA